MSISARRSQRAHFDWPLLVAVYAISLFGILCISIAMYNPETDANLSLLGHIFASRSGQMQTLWVALSFVEVAVILTIPVEILKARSSMIYYTVLGLLSFTLVASAAVNGIKSWLQTGFGRSVQPCEFAKLSVMLTLAKLLSRNEKPMSTLKDFILIIAAVGIPAGVVLLQGETGSVIVIGAMFLIMTFFAGVDWRLWLGMIALLAIGIGVIIGYAVISGSDDYRIMRLLAFTDPTKYTESGGYQLLQAQKAIGSGRMTGIGFYRSDSMSTLGYVPESSTDFIFSVVGESFGMVGGLALLAVYLFITVRMLILARGTYDKFSRLIIYGVTGMLFFHVFENIAMCIGLMPITGIPLPFMSYGGSNYITNMAGVALVVNIVRRRSSAQISFGQSGGYTMSASVLRSMNGPKNEGGFRLFKKKQDQDPKA